MKLKYLVVTGKFPLYFTFIYYRPDNDWKALTVTFSDEYKSLEE